MKKIPKSLQGVLWSRKIEKLDFKKDRDYVIHQVLAYGNIEQIKWLSKAFSNEEITQTFINSPRKNYSPSSFNFVKNYLLDLKDSKIDPEAYVKALF